MAGDGSWIFGFETLHLAPFATFALLPCLAITREPSPGSHHHSLNSLTDRLNLSRKSFFRSSNFQCSGVLVYLHTEGDRRVSPSATMLLNITEKLLKKKASSPGNGEMNTTSKSRCLLASHKSIGRRSLPPTSLPFLYGRTEVFLWAHGSWGYVGKRKDR